MQRKKGPQHHSPTIQQTRQIAQPVPATSLLTAVVIWSKNEVDMIEIDCMLSVYAVKIL